MDATFSLSLLVQKTALDRAGQFVIVLGVWAVQLLASFAWLRYFAVEWLTRWTAAELPALVARR